MLYHGEQSINFSLNILPLDTEGCFMEREFIEAVHIVGFESNVLFAGEPVWPIHIRHEANKLFFVEAMLRQIPTMYLKVNYVSQVSLKLYRIKTLSDELKLNLKEIIARTALHFSDFKNCYLSCVEILRSTKLSINGGGLIHDGIIDLVCDLSDHSEFEDNRSKLEILSMAIMISTANNCSKLLHRWRTIEAQMAYNKLDQNGISLYGLEKDSLSTLIADVDLSELAVADFSSFSDYQYHFYCSENEITPFDYAINGSTKNQIQDLETILQYFNLEDENFCNKILNGSLKIDRRILNLLESQVLYIYHSLH
jgi:hypothetical protein